MVQLVHDGDLVLHVVLARRGDAQGRGGAAARRGPHRTAITLSFVFLVLMILAASCRPVAFSSHLRTWPKRPLPETREGQRVRPWPPQDPASATAEGEEAARGGSLSGSERANLLVPLPWPINLCHSVKVRSVSHQHRSLPGVAGNTRFPALFRRQGPRVRDYISQRTGTKWAPVRVSATRPGPGGSSWPCRTSAALRRVAPHTWHLSVQRLCFPACSA